MQTSELLALPLAEHLQAMEGLWDSLCRDAPDSVLSPAWHADVLDARAKALDSGADPTSAWADVKRTLLIQLRLTRPAEEDLALSRQVYRNWDC